VSDSRSDVYVDEIVVRTRVELDSMASRESVKVAGLDYINTKLTHLFKVALVKETTEKSLEKTTESERDLRVDQIVISFSSSRTKRCRKWLTLASRPSK